MSPFITRQEAGASGIKAIEMKAGLTSSGHGEIRQAHVRLLSALRFAPTADRRLSPVEAFETGRIDPGRHRSICIARGHACHPSIRLGPGWADHKKFVNTKLLSVADDTGGIGGWLVGSVEAIKIVGSGVFQVVSQMPDTGESSCGQEHSLAGALAGNLIIAPMHLDRLLVIALDGRDPYPDIGIASRCIPTFDLVRQ